MEIIARQPRVLQTLPDLGVAEEVVGGKAGIGLVPDVGGLLTAAQEGLELLLALGAVQEQEPGGRVADAIGEHEVQAERGLVDEVVHIAVEGAVVVAAEQHPPAMVDHHPSGEVDGAHAKDNFGAALASFDADLDGDGQTEWMAGIPGADFSKNINGKPSIQGDTGMAAVFSGLNATATYVFNGRTAGDRYGTALGIAVDQTHAGQHILAIGAKKADITKTVAGKVRVQRDAGNVFVLRVE